VGLKGPQRGETETMRGNKTWAFAVIVALVMAGTALGQAQSEIAVTRADIQADRQAIVAANMTLTEPEATAFWPVYREYRGELSKVGDRAVKLITDYAASYETLTNEQASALVKEYLAIQKEILKVREKYAPLFAKVLPAKSVMRLYQIENKLDAIVMMAVVAEIPLVK
jgi:hypothetical protein